MLAKDTFNAIRRKVAGFSISYSWLNVLFRFTDFNHQRLKGFQSVSFIR